MSKRKVSPETWRERVVKGWAFRDSSKEINDAILRWLDTGNWDDLPESYHALAQYMIDDEGAVFQ